MKIKKKLSIVEKSKKEKVKKENQKLKRVYLEISKTDIYFFGVDVPNKESISEENTEAIKLAWNVVNKKLIDLESVRIGDGFQTKILKKELIKI